MTDSEIVGRVLAGETSQFGTLVDRYLPLVRGLCSSRVSNPSQHEDLVQEVFVQSYVQLNRLRDRARFGPWIARIARNHCYTWLRGQGRRARLEERLAHEVPEAAPAPESEAMRRETLEWVEGAVARLPEKLREAMTLHYLEGLSVAEAARCLDIREAALKKRLQYGRRAVGEELFANLGEAPRKRDTREVRAVVLAALPLGEMPWHAGSVAAVGAVGLLAKVIAGTAAVAVVAGAAVMGTERWQQTSRKPAPVAKAGDATPEATIASLAASQKTATDKASTAPGTGGVAATVRYRVVGAEQAQAPLVVNRRVWLVPVRFEKAKFEALLRQAGAREDLIPPMEALRTGSMNRETWRQALAKAGITERELAGEWKKVQQFFLQQEPRFRDIETFLFSPLWSKAVEAATDSAGRLEAKGLPPGDYFPTLLEPQAAALEEEPRASGIHVVPGQQWTLDIFLDDPVSAIRGEVVDGRTGEPVAGVEVALQGEPPSEAYPVTSRDDGRFAFSSALTGFGPFQLRATASTHAPATVSGERRPGVPTDVEIRLDEARPVVTGAVQNADGSPAPDITIMREKITGDGAQGSEHTNAEGQYRLPHDGGRLRLYASGVNVHSETVMLDLGPSESAVQDFVLPAWGRLVLDVRTPWGFVPEKLEHTVLMTEHGVNSGPQLKREGDTFVLPYLDAGAYELIFSVGDYDGVRVSFEIPATFGEQRQSVRLRKPVGGVRVRILQADGSPAANASFSLNWFRPSYDSDGHVSGGSSGQFRDGAVDASGEALLQGLPPGDYQLSSGGEVQFTAPTNETVVLQREPPSEPKEPEAAYVSSMLLRPIDEAGNELPFRFQDMELFILSPSGRLSDARVEAGRNTIYVLKPGYTPAVVTLDLSPEALAEHKQHGFTDRSVDAVFGRGGSLSGSALNEAGEPFSGRLLAVLPADALSGAEEQWAHESYRWVSFMRGLAQAAMTEADGSFRIDHLPPGRYYVSIDGSITRAVERGAVEVRADGETGPLTVSDPD